MFAVIMLFSAVINIAILVFVFKLIAKFVKRGKAPTQQHPVQNAPVQPKMEKKQTELDMPSTSAPEKNAPAVLRSVSAEEIRGMDYFDVRRLKDLAQKLPYMIAFADSGDPVAAFDLGQEYAAGNAYLEQDLDKAEAYLCKAIDAGIPDAMSFFAVLCLNESDALIQFGQEDGLPVEQYEPMARERYQKGVDHLARALTCYNPLALRILTNGMPSKWGQEAQRPYLIEQLTIAIQPYLEQLRARDDRSSNYVLGMLNLRGLCMPQNMAQAKAYLERSAELGSSDAAKELKNPLFMLDDDDDE